jgi:hypothetical protein
MTDQQVLQMERANHPGSAASQLEARRMFSAEVKPVSWAWRIPPLSPENTEPRE